IDVNGTNLVVLRVKPDGTTRRQSQELPNEMAARAAADQISGELISRGYSEQAASSTTATKPRVIVAQVVSPADDDSDQEIPLDLVEEATEASRPRLQRLATAPAAQLAAEAPPKPKKKKGKKKKKKAETDGLDRRVLAGVAAVGLLLLGGMIYMA